MSWLTTLSLRERVLVAVMVTLASLFMLWQLMVLPLLRAQDSAVAARDTAAQDLSLMQRAAPALRPQSTDGQAKATFERSVVIAAAREVGLPISRLQPGEGGRLQIWFEDASTAEIISLLTSLDARYRVSIVRADIARQEGGRVSAQITLQPDAVAYDRQ